MDGTFFNWCAIFQLQNQIIDLWTSAMGEWWPPTHTRHAKTSLAILIYSIFAPQVEEKSHIDHWSLKRPSSFISLSLYIYSSGLCVERKKNPPVCVGDLSFFFLRAHATQKSQTVNHAANLTTPISNRDKFIFQTKIDNPKLHYLSLKIVILHSSTILWIRTKI